MKIKKIIKKISLFVLAIFLLQSCSSLKYNDDKLLINMYEENVNYNKVMQEKIDNLNLDSSSDYIFFEIYDSFVGYKKDKINEFKVNQYLFILNKSNEKYYNDVKILKFTNYNKFEILSSGYDVQYSGIYFLGIAKLV
ncbi:MAG: hypothetical protein NTW25_00415 [Candidatus Kapabacteria bacterium]|nr:hypothetical protein [Candidatus Kapabacteria bacterium]